MIVAIGSNSKGKILKKKNLVILKKVEKSKTVLQDASRCNVTRTPLEDTERHSHPPMDISVSLFALSHTTLLSNFLSLCVLGCTYP